MKTVPKQWPTVHQAGDTMRFDISAKDFDPSADTLHVFISNSTNTYTFSSTDNGDYFRLDTSSTSGWQKGFYTIQGRVTCADGSIYTIHSSNIEIKPNLSLGNADPRSHARKVVESIEAVLEGTASSDVLAYEIKGRRLERYPLTELLKLRDKYKRELIAESGGPRFVKLRFK